MAGCTKIPLVLTDGEIEQLQAGDLVTVVQAGDLVTVVIGDLDGDIAGVSVAGNFKSVQTYDQHLLAVAQNILGELRQVTKHLQTITGEEDPL
jgi:hypothetical protein